MVDMNRDMDKYLRSRKNNRGYQDRGPSWWNSIFSPKPAELPVEDLSPTEMQRLQSMESDLKKTERKIETVKAIEHDLEEEQEQKVGFYHHVRRFFGQTHSPEHEEEAFTMPNTPVVDASVSEDFKRLAAIQMRWLDRLPSRIKDEFKESDDYHTYVEILQRRGVAKKR